MWTPLEKAAQSGAASPPPISVDRGRALKPRGDPRAIGRGGLVKRADRTSQRVEEPPPGFDDDGGGKILEACSEGERGQPFSEGVGHGSVSIKLRGLEVVWFSMPDRGRTSRRRNAPGRTSGLYRFAGGVSSLRPAPGRVRCVDSRTPGAIS